MADPKIRIRAVDDASRVIAGVSSRLDSMGLSAGRLGNVLGALGASVSAGALTAMFRGINDGVDAFNDLQDATKASIENLSALEDIGDRTGTSFETVGSALLRFNQTLKDAKPGSEAESAFRALGLEVDKLKQLDPAEALRQTSVALAKFADDGDKARLVQELFGRSVREVAPFLKNLAESGELVAKVTTEQAAAAEQFNRELFALNKNAKDAGRALVSDLVVGINAAAKAFREGGFGAGLSTLLFGNDQFRNDKAITQQTEELLALERDITRLRNSGTALDAAQARKKEERLKALRQEIKTTQVFRAQLAEEATAPAEAKKPKLPPSLSKPKVDKAAVDAVIQATSELDRYSQSLLQAIERQQDLSEVEKARLRIAEATGQGFSESKRQYVLGLAAQLDALKDATEQERALADIRARAEALSRQRIDAVTTENEALISNNRVLREQLEEIGLTADELGRLRLARLDDAIAADRQRLVNAQSVEGNEVEIEQLERRIRLRQAERDLVSGVATRRAAVDQDEQNKQRTDKLAESIEKGILTGFRDGGRAADVFLDELKAQFGKTVLRPLIQPIAEAGNKLISAGLNSLLGALSFDGGGYTGSGARSGGVDGKGGFLSVLHPQETVIDHTKGQRAGSITVNLTTQVGDVASMSYVQAAVQRGVQAALAAARRNEVYA